ncbi:MAG: hypothetical protein QXG86_01420 [Candidatus Woesearchaeota archaeon]
MFKEKIFFCVISFFLIFFLGCAPQTEPVETKIREQISRINLSPESFDSLLEASQLIESQPPEIKALFENKTSEWFIRNVEALNINDENFTAFENFEKAKNSVLWNWTRREVKDYCNAVLKNKTYDWARMKIIFIKPEDSALPIIEKVWRFQKTDVYNNNLFEEEKKEQKALLKNKTLMWIEKKLENMSPKDPAVFDKAEEISFILQKDFLRDILGGQVWITKRIEDILSQARKTEKYIFDIKITNPLNNSFIRKKTPITFLYNSSSGIKLVKVYINEELVDADTVPVFECVLDPKNYHPGVYNLTLVAYDYSGKNISQTIRVILPGESCGNKRCNYEYYENCEVCPEDCSCGNFSCVPTAVGANRIGCLVE